MVCLLRACLLLVLACASGLVMPSTLQGRALAVPARSSVQMKREVVRVEVEIEQGEPLEKALRRFRKATNMCGHLRILRNRRQFESTHDKQIRKEKESLMRLARARRSMRARMQ